MPKFRNGLERRDREDDPHMSRRTFLTLLGLGAVGGALQFLLGGVGVFLYPNALKTPPSQFSIGRPSDVLASQGKVFLPKYKIFLEVQGRQVRAQTAVCTHLGCTVNAVETGYSCPCHGSTYDGEGKNVGGPAKLPLVFYSIFEGASGDLMVDKSKEILEPLAAWFAPRL